VPPPEFLTWKLWLGALPPTAVEADSDAGLKEMLGTALTVRLTGIVCGELVAPEAVMVIVAEYVPAESPEVA
jgi:hypothetical protein